MRALPILLALLACNPEVGFSSKLGAGGVDDTAAAPTTGSTPAGTPDLVVSPRSIAVLDACVAVEEGVLLQSVGDAPVTIEAVVLTGDGWELTADPPATLAPGDEATLPLVGSTGIGLLSIQSDDPLEPLIQVDLAVAIQGPPELDWTAPDDRAELAGDAVVALAVHVFDDATPLEDLRVTFASNLDGVLGEVVPTPDGTATLDWGPPRAPGLHTVTATVTDACGLDATGLRYLTDEGVPDIEVRPGRLDAGAVCGAHDDDVTILNVGTGTLVVDAVDADGAWTATVPLPLELAPGDAADVDLRTTGGVGTLRIDSNDPDEARVEVPLTSTVDAAPEVEVHSPLPGAVLPMLGDVELVGRAMDDVDPPELLSVRWLSDVDGVIGVEAPLPDGTVRSVWPDPRALGEHLLTLEVTDSCGNVATVEVPVTQPGVPDIEVTPSEVDAIACPVAETWLTVSNVGSGDLLVSDARTVGAGWSSPPVPPPVIAPGDAWSFPLAADSGDGTFQVSSNDPDEPRVDVPLRATPDRPPTARIDGPVPDAIIGSGELWLSGAVSDDLDAPESLTVQWSSDVDGVIGGTPADPAGTLLQDWPEPRTGGDHTITLDVWDSCGNHDQAVVGICQDEVYYGDSLDLEDWTFAGVARWDEINEWIELTPVVNSAVGSAFATHEVVSAGAVEIEFLFYMGEGSGADGFSVTMLDTGRTMRTLGGDGGCLGYGEGIGCSGLFLPGWSIEVDTYTNGWDPTGLDHVAFSFDGNQDAPERWASLPEMEDTGWHSMRVEVTAPHVLVTIDGVPYIDDDIPGYWDFTGWVGFTASTGGLTNKHLIDALSVVDHLCE